MSKTPAEPSTGEREALLRDALQNVVNVYGTDSGMWNQARAALAAQAPSPVAPSEPSEAWAWRAFNPDEGGWTDWRFQSYKPPRQTDQWFQVVAMRAAIPDAERPMADTAPPATARERWFYEQGRLAERDPRTPKDEPRQAEPRKWSADAVRDLLNLHSLPGIDLAKLQSIAERLNHYHGEPRQAPSDALTKAAEALEAARNGLAWYQDACPELWDGSDDEMIEQIDAAILSTQGDRNG